MQEGSALITKCTAETHQPSATDDVHVRKAQTRDSKIVTFLAASHPWWHEQMRIHPNGWQGAPFTAIAEKFNL